MSKIIEYEKWRKDLKSTKEDERVAWIRKTLKNKRNLHIFGRYFFPHIIKGTNDVPECHIDLIDFISDPKSGVGIFPRAHAKTTWEKIDTLHDIVYSLEPVILYISDTVTSAQYHFESMKTELENNELFIYVYGYLVPPESKLGRKWTNTHFETINNINVVARGAGRGRGVNIKNQRPTKVIMDDIETDEHVRSAEQREKTISWINNVIIPSLDKERGKFKWIGTVLHKMAVIRQFYDKYGGIFRQAIEDGKSIWPNMFSLEDLDEIKDKIGTRGFMQEYMNNPTDEELANFNSLWIDENVYTAVKFIRPRKVIAIDPQAGEKETADEFCITCLGWEDRDHHRYVLEQVAGRKSQPEQAREVIRMWIRHPEAHLVGIEKLLNQTAVYQILRDWKAYRIDLGIKGRPLMKNGKIIYDRNIPITATTPEGKDKVARLQMHEPAWERGEIHQRPEMRILREQLLFLGTNLIDHDDRADSLVQAIDLSYRGNNLTNNSGEVYNSKSETIAGDLMKQKF